jgi:hypothetical protein
MKTGSRIFLLFFAFSWAAFAQFPKSAWSQLPPVIQSAVTSSNVSSLAYPANVTSGKLLSVISVWETATGTPTVADTLGSTWVQALLCTANTRKIGVYLALAASTGANTVTFTETSATRQTMAAGRKGSELVSLVHAE